MNYIYRMTHIDNIPHILKHGITHRESADADPSYIPIGDTSIIDKHRNLIRETVAGEKISLGDFIPFYFYARMPMLYNIQHGYKVERVDAENIVYLMSPSKQLQTTATANFISLTVTRSAARQNSMAKTGSATLTDSSTSNRSRATTGEMTTS